MKASLLVLFLTLTTSTYSQITNSSPYCQNGYDNGSVPKAHYISTFSIGNFSNVSGNIQWPYPHYVFYNNLTPGQLLMSYSYPYSVEFDTTGGTKQISMWIDFNRNYIMEAMENFSHSNIQPGVSQVNGIVTVPLTAGLGITRIRVSVYEDATTAMMNSCDLTTDWGETEDYEIEITNGITAFEEISGGGAVTVFPNPVSKELNVSLNHLGAKYYRIYNADSKMIVERNCNEESFIKLDMNYPSGIYILSLLTENGWMYKRFTIL